MFTEMKGINFHSLGLHSFLCMKKPWTVFFLRPQAAWYLFSRVVVQTEACSGGRGAGPPEACARPGPWRVPWRAPYMHTSTSTTGSSRTHVNHRACSSPGRSAVMRGRHGNLNGSSTSRRSRAHQSQSRGLATGTQCCLKDGRPHSYWQLSCPVWGPGSRNATAKSIITPSWAGGRLRGLSHYLAIDPNPLLRN